MEVGPNLAGNIKIPLPRPFNGKYEDWEDWSWTFKTYLHMMEPVLAPYVDKSEDLPLEIADADLAEEGNEQLSRQKLAFSRKLHYLLALITEDGTKLIVKQNTNSNGFETWRLLSHEFTLPGTTKDVGLLSQIMNFSFRTSKRTLTDGKT